MPYDSLNDLPDSVQNSLPRQAQEIYMEAFNSAWTEYKDAEDRRDDPSREEVSHRVAWSAVKKVQEKDGEHWVKRDSQLFYRRHRARKQLQRGCTLTADLAKTTRGRSRELTKPYFIFWLAGLGPGI